MRILLPWLLLGWSLLFWPGLRRWMLLSSRSLFLGCGSFLLRGMLMLGLCRLVLRHRTLLRSWPRLEQGLYLLYGLHGGGRAFLRAWPGLRSLLGNACPCYRPFSLRGVQWSGSGQRTLLYRRRLDWFTPLDGKRPVHDYRLRLTAVDGGKLCAVAGGSYPVLLLDPQLSETRLPQSSQLCRGRLEIHSPAATAVAHAVVIRDVGHIGDVGIVDDGVVYVCDPTVVVKLVVVPISAVVATANIAVTVVDTTIVANVAAPKAAMPSVAPGIVAPVTGCPQRAHVWSRDPHSRNPVITSLRIRPIARRPQIVWFRARRLLVFR